MQTTTTEPGTVRVLSAGWGDTKLSFDPKNAAERIRAARIVEDMLRRGYALLVEVEPDKWQRVERFDPEKFEYLIADFDSAVAAKVDRESSADEQEGEAAAAAEAPAAEADAPPKEKRRGGRKRLKSLPAASTRAISVGRTAGG